MPAEVLWPEREPLYDLMVHRATIGHSAFASEKQSDPVDPSLCEWEEATFTHANFWFDAWPESKDLVIKTLALDPSKGRSDRQGDYSAIVRYGLDRNGAEYVEADLARRGLDVMCADLVRQQQEFAAEGVGVESDAWQELLSIPLATAARAAGVAMPVYMLPTGGVPKVVRIRRLGAPLSQRRLRFKSRSPGTTLLVQQLRDFPHGTHDDGCDACEISRRLANQLLGKRREAQRSPGRVKT